MEIELNNKKDVHEEDTNITILSGITNLKVVLNVRNFKLPVKLTILLPWKKRGVHMSRLVYAVNKSLNDEDFIENILKKILSEINLLLSTKAEITAKFSYPLNTSDQFLKIKIKIRDENKIYYEFERIGITACPCSKEITGIGHMQRVRLRLSIESEKILDFEEIANKMKECFSATPKEYLKRIDEAKLIIESQENPKFIEDVVRDCIKKFPEAKKIEAESYESIHSHNAYALWYKEMT